MLLNKSSCCFYKKYIVCILFTFFSQGVSIHGLVQFCRVMMHSYSFISTRVIKLKMLFYNSVFYPIHVNNLFIFVITQTTNILLGLQLSITEQPRIQGFSFLEWAGGGLRSGLFLAKTCLRKESGPAAWGGGGYAFPRSVNAKESHSRKYVILHV